MNYADHGIPADLLADPPPAPPPPRPEAPGLREAEARARTAEAEAQLLRQHVRARDEALRHIAAQPPAPPPAAPPPRPRPAAQTVSRPGPQGARSRPKGKSVADLPESARAMLVDIKRIDPTFTDADYVAAYRWGA